MTSVRIETGTDGTVTLTFTRPDHKGDPASVSASFAPAEWVKFVHTVTAATDPTLLTAP